MVNVETNNELLAPSLEKLKNRQQLIANRIYHQYRDAIFDSMPAQHQKQLLEFQQAEFGIDSRQQNIKFNEWMYQDNSDNQRLYCLQNQHVVGHQSAIPVELKLGDLCVNAAYAIDLRITNEWKMKGLGVAMIGALMDQFDVLIGLGISDEAIKMFKRQGWHDLGQLHCYMKPININFIKSENSKTGMKKKIRNILALAFSVIVDRYKKMVTRNIILTPNSKFTQQHQDLYEKLTSHSVNTVKRGSKFLNWRYCDFPGRACYEIYDYYSDTGKLDGFTVVKESFREGKKTLKVVELIANTDLLACFINELVKMAHKKKMDIILFQFLDPVLRTELKKHAFYKIESGANFMVYNKDQKLNVKINEIRNWQVSYGESDLDFSFD